MKRYAQKLVLLLFSLAILTQTAHAAEVALKVLDGVELHAFASSSYTFNFNQPTQRPPNGATNVNRIFDTDHNSFKFDVGELVILKDTPKPGDVGFRTDLTYGFSVPEVTKSAPGVTDSTGARLADEDFDVQQAYVSYNAPIGSGLQLDLGKFITHIGAEVIEGYDGFNSNFSRSFLFGLAIPFTHTGLRAGYTINDMISVMGMVANGGDNTVDSNDGKTLGAQIAITPTDSVSLLLNWAGGQETALSNNTTHYFDVVLDVALTNSTSAQLNFDYGITANGAAAGGDAEWWGVAGIVRHDYNKWFSINLRGEFFNDLDGARSFFAGNIVAAGTTPAGQGQELWEITVTPEVRVNQNMVVRMEYRHDESSRTEAFFDSGAGKTQSTQDTIALNALFYF